MRNSMGLTGVAVCVAALAMHGPARADDGSPSSKPIPQRRGGSSRFDLNIEGGLGKTLQRDGLTGFARARAGWLTVVEPRNPQGSPLYVTVGGTLATSDLGLFSVGLQGELMHLSSGFWAQGGGFVDVTKPGPGVALSAGWSLFGVEFQRRFVDEGRALTEPRADWAVYGKLRIPVTIIMSAF